MKIGELARRAGVAASAIRFYEAQGLLPLPSRGPNGYRDYDEASLQRLLALQLAQRLGFKLDQLRGVMREGEGLPHQEVADCLRARLQEIDALQAALQAQRRETETLLARVQQAWADGRCLILPEGALAP